jgi:isohexenylglutaconyl-CoA hydratase
VLRGAGGSFCAGADLKDMTNLRMKAFEKGNEVYVQFNRSFGTLIQMVNQAPQIVVAVLEGAVLGGGFGLACVSDVALCLDNTKFGLPETGLGVIPAQIAPFVVQRIGLTQARRYALLGNRFDGAEAERIGLVHQSLTTVELLDAALNEVLTQIKRTAPNASRVTKEILHRAAALEPLEGLLDDVAVKFAEAVTTEGMEGTMAFVQKRLPSWAE